MTRPANTEAQSREGPGRYSGIVLALTVAVAAATSILWAALSLDLQPPAVPAIGDQMPDHGYRLVPADQPLEYRDHPPASGTGYPAPATSGVYAGGLAPGYWIHSLGQGYIVLLYRPPISKTMEWIFQAMVWAFPRSKFGNVKLVIAPYEDMPHRYAVVAWDWRLWLNRLDLMKILAFYRAHVDHGPEDRS